MRSVFLWSGLAAVVSLWGVERPAAAAIVRYHYVPSQPPTVYVLQPFAPGVAGELLTWFGLRGEPYPRAPKPNHLAVLCHPFTRQNVTVPLQLPPGTPTIMHSGPRVIYNYGSYTVTVRFYEDGTLDVIYNSGLFRDI
ncbi:MAG: hypothetical protein ACK4RK_01870 [Gemmataceae bacterium]